MILVFLWNKKIPIEEANFYIIQKDMEKLFKKAGVLEK